VGCNCRGGGSVVFQVRRPDGTTKRYASEAEAKAAAKSTGGEYQQLRR
jgi:hypothetical protein